MTQYKQFIAMLKGRGIVFTITDWRESCYPDEIISVHFTNNTETTSFNFSTITEQLISVEVESSHYSD